MYHQNLGRQTTQLIQSTFGLGENWSTFRHFLEDYSKTLNSVNIDLAKYLNFVKVSLLNDLLTLAFDLVETLVNFSLKAAHFRLRNQSSTVLVHGISVDLCNLATPCRPHYKSNYDCDYEVVEISLPSSFLPSLPRQGVPHTVERRGALRQHVLILPLLLESRRPGREREKERRERERGKERERKRERKGNKTTRLSR